MAASSKVFKFLITHIFKIALFIFGAFLFLHLMRFITWSPNHLVDGGKEEQDGLGSRSPSDVPTVSVFYETLCPDSRSFILRQLVPTVLKLSQWLNVVLIPYGKAETHENPNGDVTFTCQHGAAECEGNKLHACAIDLIGNSTVSYIGCCMEGKDRALASLKANAKKCADKHNVSWDAIAACLQSPRGSFLLKQAGIITKALHPPPSFIPTILINGGGRENQAGILKNLLKEMCQYLQSRHIPECNNYDLPTRYPR